jgi:PAS domain S-box-containing protein
MDPHPRSTRSKLRLLRIIDRFLSEQQRQLSPDDLRRRRIMAGIPLSLVSLGGPLIVLLWLMGMEHRAVIAALVVMCVNIGALATLRLNWNASFTAFVLGANVNVIVFFTSFYRDCEAELLGPWSFVNVVVATYLGGARLGLGFVGAILAEVVVARWAHQVGWIIPTNIYEHPELPNAIAGAMGLLILAVFGWLNQLAQREAHEAVTRALKIKEEGEANLLSLIESTGDLVYALDPNLRLVAMNSAYREAVTLQMGREPKLGEPILELHRGGNKFWASQYQRALAGEHISHERHEIWGDRNLYFDVSVNPIAGGKLGCTAFVRDITARKEQEENLRVADRQMTDLSRQAGMAEVATGILHNVGNALNSVNVSTHLLADRLRASKLSSLGKAVELIEAHASDLGQFLSEDPKGKQLPKFLAAVNATLGEERTELLDEVGRLAKNVEHIKAVVATQQTLAKVGGVQEEIQIGDVLDDALALHSATYGQLEIPLVRNPGPGPRIRGDRHRMLQILVNLIGNAQHALQESSRKDKRLEIHTLGPDKGRFQIEVCDNGIGIAPENLKRMFSQGFTTKKAGHGFGLHMSVLTAKAMGGALTCRSDGVDRGATFTLDLPVAQS